MDDASLFEKLLQIRNIRADGLARQLAALRHRLVDMEAEAEALALDLHSTGERADAASPTRLLQLGQRVNGQDLHKSLRQAAMVKAELEQLRQRHRSVEGERLNVKEAAAQYAVGLARAVRIVRRTECVLESLKEDAPGADDGSG
ncbi:MULTISPECIES: hypothetical protein [Rhizobium]|uniref:Uncharacterized protein n=1 Tax=Rhizobium leguminosarum TaxID=384 RepID=A0A1L3ZM96_RHILE|nr:hypothetical protein [Rhizobium leguminosarum]API56731.1 hypothetical protein BMW22_35355 [Rhizobium leguminosarum]